MTPAATGVPATDILVSPFSADGSEMVEAASRAERAGFDGVLTLDHFTGAMLERGWSREPFTVLGAVAATTDSVRVGPLVVNVTNRHPVVLASAAATVQSLSRGRLVLGLGTGPVPGTRFAAEPEAAGQTLADADTRRRRLVETMEIIRLLWRGGGDFDGEFHSLRRISAVVGPEAEPPIVIGASTPETIELAVRYADGVNIRVVPGWEHLVRLTRDLTRDRSFEIGIHDLIDIGHPFGGALDTLAELGVDRRVLAVKAPYPLDRLAEIGAALQSL